nr:MAG TPA: hypothetical protein [Caudoviricetes sp.]
MDVPMECRITLSNTSVGEWQSSTHSRLSARKVMTGYSPHVKTYHQVMPLAWGIII